MAIDGSARLAALLGGVDHGAAFPFAMSTDSTTKSVHFLRRVIQWWPYLFIAISISGFIYRAAR
jgi:hypothetical protein